MSISKELINIFYNFAMENRSMSERIIDRFMRKGEKDTIKRSQDMVNNFQTIKKIKSGKKKKDKVFCDYCLSQLVELCLRWIKSSSLQKKTKISSKWKETSSRSNLYLGTKRLHLTFKSLKLRNLANHGKLIILKYQRMY